LILLEEREKLFLGTLFDEIVPRSGFLEFGVGDDDFTRIHVRSVNALRAEGRSYDAAGDALAVADNEVGDARGELEDGGETAQDFIERVEFLVD